jgi:hypothetical protein
MKISDLPTSDPVKGRKILKSIIVVGTIIAAMVVLILQVIWWSPAEPVIYNCTVDTVMLGIQSTDLCNIVPEAVRQKNNVVVTGGMTTFSAVMRVKDVPDTVYYNLLTPAQQIDTLVKIPGPIRSFEKYGFFGGMLAGALLVPLLYIFFRIGKRVAQERKRAFARQERQGRIQQKGSQEQRELNFDVQI